MCTCGQFYTRKRLFKRRNLEKYWFSPRKKFYKISYFSLNHLNFLFKLFWFSNPRNLFFESLGRRNLQKIMYFMILANTKKTLKIHACTLSMNFHFELMCSILPFLVRAIDKLLFESKKWSILQLLPNLSR